MPLRKFKTEDGDVVVEIPEEHFRCPKCKAGYQANSLGGGLFSEDDRDDLTEDQFYSDEYITCDALDEDGYRCEWSGSALSIYNRAVKKANLVKCPCCKGTGLVRKDKLP